MSDEQIIRDALQYVEPGPDVDHALDALDRLLQRAEAAEKALRDEWELAEAWRDERLAAAEARCATLEAALREKGNAIRKVRMRVAHSPRCVCDVCTPSTPIRDALAASQPADWKPVHNHRTRDIKAPGVCPGCDDYHRQMTARRRPQPAEEEGTAFERSLLRADIKAGNADAAEAQLQRIKRLEAGTGQ